MKDLHERIQAILGDDLLGKLEQREFMRRKVVSLLTVMTELYGPDKLVLKAGRMGVLRELRSSKVDEQVLAIRRIVMQDPTLELPPGDGVREMVDEIEEELADEIARRTVEEGIERKVSERMQLRHEEYVREVRMQVMKEAGNCENPQTLKKYAQLEKLERVGLATSAMELLRPASLSEVIGQDRAVRALLAKIASPYPQHVLLYGPPGVGKTTVARLALQKAKGLPDTPFRKDAPFVEVDGTTLRWDPREVTNPLLGSVHDPIYQGARRDLADGGVPEPKLGLVTEAHGGVLFIDELGELDPMLQNKLLKVLEDKRVSYDSSYYDPSDPAVPRYIKKLFEEGAPADFLLIGATTRDPEDISPAFRSRCAEVFFDPLTPDAITTILVNAVAKLKVRLATGVIETIAEYTIEARKAIGMLADAYGLALYRHRESGRRRGKPILTIDDVHEVIQASRLTPSPAVKASSAVHVGRSFAVGVHGYVGSVLEIEAVTFPAAEKGKGRIRFNETAGSMTRDSVFNAASVIRRLSGKDLADYDVHVNVIGGAKIDGPSAGAAITLAILSALTNRPLWQDVAVTGEISIRGYIHTVGGIYEKIYGAKQAGMRKLLLPKETARDIPGAVGGIELVPVSMIDEAMAHALQPLESCANG